MNPLKRSAGSTVIETLGIIIVATTLVIYAAPKFKDVITNRLLDDVAEATRTVIHGARRHHVKHGAWPTSPSQLSSRGFLTWQMTRPTLGGSYIFTTTTVSGEQFFRIQFDAVKSEYARRLRGRLPFGSTTGSTGVRTQIPVPGQATTNDANDLKYYHRDGSRTLTGALAGGNQNAVNLRDIEMNRLIDRNNRSMILDPSGRSTINDLTADIIDATTVNATTVNADTVNADRVNAGYTETENLNITDGFDAGDFCIISRDGNVAVSDTAGEGVLICESNRWTAQPKGSTYHNISPVSLYGSSSGISSSTRLITLPSHPRINNDFTAVELQFLCNSSNDASGNVIYVGNTSANRTGINLYTFDAQVATTSNYTLERSGSSRQLRIRGNRTFACEHGAYVSVIGYWGPE